MVEFLVRVRRALFDIDACIAVKSAFRERENRDRLTGVKRAAESALHHGPAGARRRLPEEPEMQFELSTCHLDATQLSAALRPLDPDARIALDAVHGRLEVISTATALQVQDVLREMGCTARPLEQDVHVSGGSTCCGQCS
ncbi:hypothetical protein ACTJIL_03485 [Luteimonas sp. 22616]|uniref:hypothetical protein n=1 Tax=Luteimonas sp. 22616 TaxID=3453951 RepID=UPI003F834AC3